MLTIKKLFFGWTKMGKMSQNLLLVFCYLKRRKKQFFLALNKLWVIKSLVSKTNNILKLSNLTELKPKIDNQQQGI
jgi:hypothetical protein